MFLLVGGERRTKVNQLDLKPFNSGVDVLKEGWDDFDNMLIKNLSEFLGKRLGSQIIRGKLGVNSVCSEIHPFINQRLLHQFVLVYVLLTPEFHAHVT